MFRIVTTLTGIPGAPYYSTWHFNEAALTAQDAADATVAWWTAVDNLFANDLTWVVPTTVDIVDPVLGETTGVTSVTGGTGTGADSTSYLPQINQVVVRIRTGVFVGGREVRGRIFVPGLTEAASQDGILDATWLSTFNAANAALLADADSSIGVYSRAHNVFHVASAMSVWTQFAALRSRRD